MLIIGCRAVSTFKEAGKTSNMTLVVNLNIASFCEQMLTSLGKISI